MMILQQATYIHPNKEVLFQDLTLIVNKQDKIALIGNNGSGKSTILKIIAGELTLQSGTLSTDDKPYYIPQSLNQYNDLSIAEALGVAGKLNALHAILQGDVSAENMEILHDDWTLEERCEQALATWNIADLDLNRKMDSLSGGQKTKVFLAGIDMNEASFILMDEPSNHLDRRSRAQLYDFIEKTNKTILLVSHDRQLLQLIPTIAELGKDGIRLYGGNFDFYQEQKEIEQLALNHQVQSQQKELRKAKDKEREANERQQKLNARGKRKQEAAGIPKILMNGLKNKAENSTSKLKSVHEEKISGIQSHLSDLRSKLPEIDQMQFGFEESNSFQGKLLFDVKAINYLVNQQWMWDKDLSFQIRYGERIALKGDNGSGKTSLIKLLLGEHIPGKGEILANTNRFIYVDQDYSLIQGKLSIYEMAQTFNQSGLQEHEIKIRLNRFLFGRESWDKPCASLSGGERMRLLLCGLNISNQSPDVIVLDEPTNNIDIQNILILTSAIRRFKGTLLVVSHDQVFLNDIAIDREIQL